MSDSMTQDALKTVELLERRLQRVQFLLTGVDEAEDALQQAATEGKDFTVYARLVAIETGLQKVSSDSRVIHDLLDLYRTYPELFQPAALELPPTLFSTAELLSVVGSCATSYPTTASRLNSIKDLPLPSAELSASLIALQPRMAQLELLQESQAKEVAELRLKSAAVIQRWYELGVLGGGECWTEWERRVMNAEKIIRREEIHRARDMEAMEVYKS